MNAGLPFVVPGRDLRGRRHPRILRLRRARRIHHRLLHRIPPPPAPPPPRDRHPSRSADRRGLQLQGCPASRDTDHCGGCAVTGLRCRSTRPCGSSESYSGRASQSAESAESAKIGPHIGGLRLQTLTHTAIHKEGFIRAVLRALRGQAPFLDRDREGLWTASDALRSGPPPGLVRGRRACGRATVA